MTDEHSACGAAETLPEPVGGLVCLHFLGDDGSLCLLEIESVCAVCVCVEEAGGAGGKFGSVAALMSHGCLDEVIQSCGHFFCAKRCKDQMFPFYVLHEKSFNKNHKTLRLILRL